MWLTAPPPEKLRLQPSLEGVVTYNFRVGQLGLSLLLASFPEAVRKEIIATRKTHCTKVIFRLYQIYQPGGTMERANLLKSLAGSKVGPNLAEVLASLGQWRRWLSRAEELQIALIITRCDGVSNGVEPDGGGSGKDWYSNELSSDMKPSIEAIKLFSEYIEASLRSRRFLQCQGHRRHLHRAVP